jgi:hypothetical protein
MGYLSSYHEYYSGIKFFQMIYSHPVLVSSVIIRICSIFLKWNFRLITTAGNKSTPNFFLPLFVVKIFRFLHCFWRNLSCRCYDFSELLTRSLSCNRLCRHQHHKALNDFIIFTYRNSKYRWNREIHVSDSMAIFFKWMTTTRKWNAITTSEIT